MPLISGFSSACRSKRTLSTLRLVIGHRLRYRVVQEIRLSRREVSEGGSQPAGRVRLSKRGGR
jgi:hypothetical protein